MRTCLPASLQPCCSPARQPAPTALPGRTHGGPPELPCPESGEPGALRIGRFPDGPSQEPPEQSVLLFSGWGTQPRLLPTGPAGSGRGQPLLHGRLPGPPASHSCPVSVPEPAAHSRTPDRPLNRRTQACPTIQGSLGGVWGLGAPARTGSECGWDPPSQPSPEPQDAPKVTPGGGGAGSQPAPPSSAAPPSAAGVTPSCCSPPEASPAPRPHKTQDVAKWGVEAQPPRQTARAEGVTAAGTPLCRQTRDPSPDKGGPYAQRPYALPLAVSRMYRALAAWAGP